MRWRCACLSQLRRKMSGPWVLGWMGCSLGPARWETRWSLCRDRGPKRAPVLWTLLHRQEYPGAAYQGQCRIFGGSTFRLLQRRHQRRPAHQRSLAYWGRCERRQLSFPFVRFTSETAGPGRPYGGESIVDLPSPAAMAVVRAGWHLQHETANHL